MKAFLTFLLGFLLVGLVVMSLSQVRAAQPAQPKAVSEANLLPLAQTAKLIEFGYVGIDSVAGPSEVLIIASEGANPSWVAADMLSQAEHDPGSAVLYTVSKHLADQVLAELKKQLESLTKCLD